MMLKSITFCCFLLSVQAQNQRFYTPLANNPAIIFPDSPLSVVPLSVPNRNDLDNNAIRNIFQNDQSQRSKPTTSVEIEQGYVSELGTTVEQIPNDNNRNNLITPTTPGRNLAQQFGTQRQIAPQVTPNWQPASQTSYDRQTTLQRTPEAQSIHDSSLDRSNSQRLTQGLPNSSQSGQRVPVRSQGDPSAIVFQNGQNKPAASNRPAGFPIPSKPPPSSYDFNFPGAQAPGFNKLLYSVTNFGINMIKTIKGLHPGNVVVSPFSITLLLGLLQQGASGQTQAQITKALQMPVENTAPAYRKVSEDVQARNSRNILRVANNIFVSDNFALTKDFKIVAERSFNSEVTSLSFSRAPDAARQINSWVASRTDGKIEQLISPDAIDYTTQLVLVNAIYFKGLWEVPFRTELTGPKDFYLSNGQSKTAQFMRMRKLFRTGVDKAINAEVLILPFERDEYQLMVILPSKTVGMDRTLESLTAERLLSYLSFNAVDTELQLPKFTIRADTDLTVVLKEMNITELFRRQYSELNGIGYYGPTTPYISSAVHSAFLSIDEKGGTAAAATAFAAVALSYDDPDVEFKVNRPFITILWDKQSSLPLFMAKIEDPAQ